MSPVTREAMARALLAAEDLDDLADAALALVQVEIDEQRQRAEITERWGKAIEINLRETCAQLDAMQQRAEAAERERDRQYDFNVEQIAKQAALEAQLQALQQELADAERLIDAIDSECPNEVMRVRAALASPPAPVVEPRGCPTPGACSCPGYASPPAP